MSALSERLKDAKGTRGLDDIVRLADQAGHKIDRSVVARYLTGKHGRPTDRTLEALAAGLRVDVRELRVLARMPPGELEPYEPTVEAARLNREQRKALDQLIRAIVRGDGSDAHAKPTEKMPSAGLSRRGSRRLPGTAPTPAPAQQPEPGQSGQAQSPRG